MPLPLLALGGLFQGGAMAYWATTNLYQNARISQDNAAYRDLQWYQANQQDRYLDLKERELNQEGYNNAWRMYDSYNDAFNIQQNYEHDIEMDERFQANQLERMYVEHGFQSQRDAQYFQRQLALGNQSHSQYMQRDALNYNRDLQRDSINYARDMERDNLQFQRSMIQTNVIHASDMLQADERNRLQLALQDRELDQEDKEKNNYLQERIFSESHHILSQYGNETDVNKLSYIIIKLKQQLPATYLHTPIQSQSYEGFSDVPEDWDYAQWHTIPGEEF